MLRLVCPFIAILLISCDKSKITSRSDSTDRRGPRVSRVDRSRNEHAPSLHQHLSKSLAEVKTLESQEAKDRALAEIAWSAIGTEPELSERAISGVSADSLDKLPLIEAYASQLAQQDPDRAFEWASSLGSQSEIKAAKDEIIQVLADKDPQHAAKILGKPSSGTIENDSTMLHVIRRWTADKPAEAAAWVITIPSEEARNVAIRNVASGWTETDSKAAFSWASSLGNQEIRHEALIAMAKVLVEQPEEVRNAFLETADNGFRIELLRQLDQLAPQSTEDQPVTEPKGEPTMDEPVPEPIPDTQLKPEEQEGVTEPVLQEGLPNPNDALEESLED